LQPKKKKLPHSSHIRLIRWWGGGGATCVKATQQADKFPDCLLRPSMVIHTIQHLKGGGGGKGEGEGCPLTKGI